MSRDPLEVALGHDKGQRFFDDPYVAVDHAGDLWGFGVGLPPEHDHAPDVTHRGWMRLAVPDPQDSNRTRWSTDPLWEIIQRAPFSTGLPKPLRRAKHVQPDLDQLGAQMRDYFISWAVLRGSYRPGPASLARELAAFAEWAAQFEQEKGVSFAEDVRERARLSGPLRRRWCSRPNYATTRNLHKGSMKHPTSSYLRSGMFHVVIL